MRSVSWKVGLVLLCAIASGAGAYLVHVRTRGGATRAPVLSLARPAHGTPLGLVLSGRGSVQAAESPTRSAGQARSRSAPARLGGESLPEPDDARLGGGSSPEPGDQSQPSVRSPSSPRRPDGAPAADPLSGSSFSIAIAEGVGAALYPGAAPQSIALVLGNPGDAPIYVTSLSVAVPNGPPGCDPAVNVGIVQSDVSSAAPLEVPAHGSVTLPGQGHSAPAIQLLDLPVDQDACQNARFPLSFTGSAHS